MQGDALDAITLRSPLLLVFEDLQWVDCSTVGLVSVLARRRTAAKLMFRRRHAVTTTSPCQDIHWER